MGEFESILDLVRHMSREIENAKQQHDQIMSENTLPLVSLHSNYMINSLDRLVGAGEDLSAAYKILETAFRD
jgi:hypothetical protein